MEMEQILQQPPSTDLESISMSGVEAVRWSQGPSGPPGPALINALPLIGYRSHQKDSDGDANRFPVGPNDLNQVDLTSAEIVK